MTEPVRPIEMHLSTGSFHDLARAEKNRDLIRARLGQENFQRLALGFNASLPWLADPDRALNNLEQFLAHPGATPFLPQVLENQDSILLNLLQVFASSQSFSDLLTLHPDCIVMLGVPLRQTPSLMELTVELGQAVGQPADDASVLRELRRFKQRHTLRIGGNDILRNRPLEEVTLDISRLAESLVQVALEAAWANLEKRFGIPLSRQGSKASCAVFAFGKLGGEELNYSSDIDLMLLFDHEGTTTGNGARKLDNADFFARLAAELIRLLSSHTERGWCLRVDFRLRPEGEKGPLARSMQSALAYYDSYGRTFERQALIKVRPIAGDPVLGQEFLKAIAGFVYRRYLSFAEINEIKALKRRIEQNSQRQGLETRDVKVGRGGIRDIEFTIQFLQLLNGEGLPQARQGNTLLAMQALERAGCLTDQELRVLEDSYRFLRKTEHRLQALFNLQTHKFPEGEREIRALALRLGFADDLEEGLSAQEKFLTSHREKTTVTHRILDHLLHQTFEGGPELAVPESDLLLDPNPEPETIQQTLGKYPFKNCQAAYLNLTQLAREDVPYLSTPRCRHFLASIAPDLLEAIASAPDPDMALVNLEKVSASLGGKTVLWELFSFNPPSLRLYVDLCSWSQFLSEILINNPGMIDELLDSLVLDQPRKKEDFDHELLELCRNADDLDPILHSFHDKELLRIGVRDILGKDTVHATLGELTALAESVLNFVADAEMEALQKRWGRPLLSQGPRSGRPCRHVIVGLGKLGGKEMNYHSDLDLLILYEGEGKPEKSGAGPGDNQAFFTLYTQNLIRGLARLGPLGKLYEVDMRLRPTGASGSLVLPLQEFTRYHSQELEPRLWERLMLTRARIVQGDKEFGAEVMINIHRVVCGGVWNAAYVPEARSMRDKLQASRHSRDLKRGAGGMADVEFLAELLQIRHGRGLKQPIEPNLQCSLALLTREGILTPDEHQRLAQGYNFLLKVQSRLRIVHNLAINAIPEKKEEAAKLARRLGYSHDAFQQTLEAHQREIRQVFDQVLNRIALG